jgi:hypothetical protein
LGRKLFIDARRLAPRGDLGGRPGAPTDQAAVDAEVLAREQAADLRLIQNLGQKLGGDIAREQAIPVLREGRMIPDLIVDPEPDEPAEQQVEVQPLHQLALRADRVERLQQERPQQLFGRDRRSSHAGIEVMEARRQPRERLVDDRPNGPQRMGSRHPGLEIDVAEQGTRPLIRPAHLASSRWHQLASECHSERVFQRPANSSASFHSQYTSTFFSPIESAARLASTKGATPSSTLIA